jgi:hypothetical protein
VDADAMKRSKYSRELLEPLVREAFSIGQVLRNLGLRPTGGNYRMVHTRLRVLGIATDHFRGQGWSRGETVQTHPTVTRIARRNTWPDREVFVENSPVICGYRIIRRLRRLGWKYECSECEISEWRGRTLKLHLDHKNGVNNDNRLENLRLLCPNCHSQTETYCRKKNSKHLAR